MRFHRLASILSFFCCQTVGSLCVLHFRICDVSSETGRSKSFVCRCVQDRFGCRKFFRTPLDRRRIVAIVCDTAVSRRERFTSRERVRQTVAFRPAFACSVFVRFHFKPESAQQRRCRLGKLQAEPLHSRSASSHAASDCRSDTPQAGLGFASDGTASWLG